MTGQEAINSKGVKGDILVGRSAKEARKRPDDFAQSFAHLSPRLLPDSEKLVGLTTQNVVPVMRSLSAKRRLAKNLEVEHLEKTFPRVKLW